jgi:hypothetical protein
VYNSLQYFWLVVKENVVELLILIGVDCTHGTVVTGGVVGTTSMRVVGTASRVVTMIMGVADTGLRLVHGYIKWSLQAQKWHRCVHDLERTSSLGWLVVMVAAEWQSDQPDFLTPWFEPTWLRHMADFGFRPAFSQATATLSLPFSSLTWF